MKSLYYVGMDVHKDSIRIAVLKCIEKEKVNEATVENKIPKIVKILCVFMQKRKNYEFKMSKDSR